jgi:hypothetical protein
MTITSSPPAPALGFVALAGWPQVDLMPPEVRAGRRLKRTKRMLAIIVVGVVAVSGLAYVAAVLSEASAASEVEAVQQDTVKLTADKAKFAEVPRLLGEISGAETARRLGTSTEVLWTPYLDAIRAVTPAEVSIDTLTVTGATPMQAAASPSDPLAAPSIGMITLSAKSLTIINTSDWLNALDGIPGFADASFSGETISENAGVVYYEVKASVQVNSQALANRFAAKKGK